jgi:hypothetical protein
MIDLEKLMKEGFPVSPGAVVETLVTYGVASSLWGSVILKNQMEILARLKGEEVDPRDLDMQIKELADLISQKAAEVKNDWIAKNSK